MYVCTYSDCIANTGDDDMNNATFMDLAATTSLIEQKDSQKKRQPQQQIQQQQQHQQGQHEHQQHQHQHQHQTQQQTNSNVNSSSIKPSNSLIQVNEAMFSLLNIKCPDKNLSIGELNALANLCYDTRLHLYLSSQTNAKIEAKLLDGVFSDADMWNSGNDGKSKAVGGGSASSLLSSYVYSNTNAYKQKSDKKRQRVSQLYTTECSDPIIERYINQGSASTSTSVSNNDNQQVQQIVEPAIAFYLGCKVLIVKENKEGVVVCEKAGGWRDIKFADGSVSRFRPSELKRLSPHKTISASASAAAVGSSNNHNLTKCNLLSHQQLQQHRIYRYDSNNSDDTRTSSCNHTDTTAASVTNEITQLSMSSDSKADATAMGHSNEESKYISPTTAAVLKCGTRLTVRVIHTHMSH